MMRAVIIIHFLSVVLYSITGLAVLFRGIKGTLNPGDVLTILLVLTVAVQVITYIRDSVLKNKNKNLGVYLLSSAKVMVPKGEFVNLNVKADTELYKKGLIPTNVHPKRECVYIVGVEVGEFPEAPELIMTSSYNSKTTAHRLNNGFGLSNNGSYMFNIVARSGELINFKFNTGGIVKKFVVEEFYIP